jgi:hypothetical protein
LKRSTKNPSPVLPNTSLILEERFPSLGHLLMIHSDEDNGKFGTLISIAFTFFCQKVAKKL